MGDENDKIIPRDYLIENIKAEIELSTPSRRQRIFESVAFAALGSIPWIGGVIAVAASAASKYRDNASQGARDDLLMEWLREHEDKLQELRSTLERMVLRLEGFGEEVEARIQSDEYLNLVRKTFRQWDEADTTEKRRLLVQLITNAGGTRVASDDIVRLFLDWLDTYHGAHLAIVREIHANPGATRYEIWAAIYGEPVPRDDSAQADLYRMLIRDLSTGGVVRQPRESDDLGRFIKKKQPPRRTPASGTMESAFEDSKPYVLTELGSQFVHYTMTELVSRLKPGQN